MLSKITDGATTHLFTTTILNKHEVKYYKCNQTGFIQTEEPYWLDEAYSSAITKLDIGLLSRNIHLCKSTEDILLKHFNIKGKFLDYGGGYGTFTRLMRDKGFDFYNTDRFCENLFAEYFDLSDIAADTKFELVTAFEVLEHLTDPYTEIEKVLVHADNFLFTTELQPKEAPKDVNDWWYFIPETGQHVSLYTEASLKYIADKLGYHFYSNSYSTHLFTKNPLASDPFYSREPFFIRKMRKFLKKYDKGIYARPESLLQTDWQTIKNKLK